MAAEQPVHRLVLVRHAKSDYPFGVADHDRPLNGRGQRDAPFIGSWIRDHVPWPDGQDPLILVSTALRAQLTWALARKGLDDRWRADLHRDEPRIYEASARLLREVIATLPEDAHTAVLVGHNPGMIDLVASVGQDGEAYRQAVLKFPTSAVAVLTTSSGWHAALDPAPAFAVEAFAVPRA